MKESAKHLILIIFIGVMAFLISRFAFQLTFVNGDSMAPTLHNRQLLITAKHFSRSDLTAGDIVVARPSALSRTIIKRIAGLPGQTIEIRDGRLYADGSPLSEEYLHGSLTPPGEQSYPLTLAEDEYFLLGDNREHSTDSRFLEVGVIRFQEISGKVIFAFA